MILYKDKVLAYNGNSSEKIYLLGYNKYSRTRYSKDWRLTTGEYKQLAPDELSGWEE